MAKDLQWPWTWVFAEEALLKSKNYSIVSSQRPSDKGMKGAKFWTIARQPLDVGVPKERPGPYVDYEMFCDTNRVYGETLKVIKARSRIWKSQEIWNEVWRGKTWRSETWRSETWRRETWRSETWRSKPEEENPEEAKPEEAKPGNKVQRVAIFHGRARPIFLFVFVPSLCTLQLPHPGTRARTFQPPAHRRHPGNIGDRRSLERKRGHMTRWLTFRPCRLLFVCRVLLQQQKLLPLAGLRFSTVEPTPAVNPLSTAIVAFKQRLCLSELWKPAQKKKKK